MKLKYLGHACFLATAADGTKVLMDPYRSGAFGNAIRYGPIEETVDIVLTSHDHEDHGWVQDLPGSPAVFKREGAREAKGIAIRGIAAFHDSSAGSQRGKNIIFCFTMDGVRICHCGDLGHVLSDEQAKEIGAVDVLLVPVGGFFTIDARGADQVVQKLQPKITIPMHYKTSKANMPIALVDDFLKGKTNARHHGSPEIEITPETLPSEPQIIVLPPFL